MDNDDSVLVILTSYLFCLEILCEVVLHLQKKKRLNFQQCLHESYNGVAVVYLVLQEKQPLQIHDYDLAYYPFWNFQ